LAIFPIIHIGESRAEVDSSYIPKVEVVGDISDALNEIARRAERNYAESGETARLKAQIRLIMNNMPMMMVSQLNLKKLFTISAR
jgi:thiamine pyrophosphate-dependent acetolactate synthase large subunit-like protein